MNEPKRWLSPDSDAPDEARELLRSAEAMTPLAPAVDRRVSRKLALFASVPMGLGAWLAAHKAVALVSVALIGSATVTGVVVVHRWRQPAPVPAPVRAARTGTKAPRGAASPTKTVQPLPLPAASAQNPDAHTTRPSRRRQVRNQTRALPSDSLAAEADLLERVRAMLDSRPRQALALLRAYDRRFPRGALALERQFLELDALYHAGKHRAARAKARQFLAHHPKSAYDERVRQILDR